MPLDLSSMQCPTSVLSLFLSFSPFNFDFLPQKLNNHGQRFQPSEPLSTALYTLPSSIDFATRVAKILARRTELPAYVGCSVGSLGATVEEELEAVRLAVKSVMEVFLDEKRGG